MSRSAATAGAYSSATASTARRIRYPAVGPFDVSEAVPVDDVQLSSADAALRRLPEFALGRVEAGIRAGVLAVEA